MDNYTYHDIEKNPTPDQRHQIAVVALVEQTKDGPEVKLELEEIKEGTFNPYERQYTPDGHNDKVEEYMKSVMHNSRAVNDMKYESNHSAKPEHLLDSASSDDEQDFKITRDEKGHPVKYEAYQSHQTSHVSNLNPHVSNPHTSNVHQSNASQGYNPLMSSLGEHKSQGFNY